MTNPPPISFGRLAIRGGAAMMAAQILKVGLQFASVVLLARLLVPEDFGLVAAVGPVAAFVGLLQEFGLQQAVVQRREISEAQLNQIFWLSALVGLCSSLVVAAAGPIVSAFYDDPRMLWIMIASAYPVFFGSLLAVPFAILNRHLRFFQLAINDLIVAFSGLIAAIVAARLGFSYWSLVISSAVSVTVALAAAWITAGWKPARPDIFVHPDIVKFGANLTGFNIANFFARNLDNVLIAKFAGTLELGYYDRAYKLLLFPLQNINQPLSRVMVPLLSRIQDDKARFRDIYVRTNWLLAATIVPGIAALTITSKETVALLFGQNWSGGVAPIFTWLGIAGLVQPVANTTGWIFICQAKTKTMFRWDSTPQVLQFYRLLSDCTGVPLAWLLPMPYSVMF